MVDNKFHETLVKHGFTTRLGRLYYGGKFPLEVCVIVKRHALDGDSWSLSQGPFHGTTVESLERYLGICFTYQENYFASREIAMGAVRQ
jgi:hypothetical protein